jgi:hypothetical protein
MRKRTSSSREIGDVSDEELARILFPKDFDLPDDLEDLSNAIGGLVLAWGNLECMLHLIAVVAWDRAGGKAIELALPRAFSRKLRFLRRCFRELDPFKPFADQCRPLLEKAADLGDDRHAIIHAMVSRQNPETGRVRFISLDGDSGGHLVSVRGFTVDEIRELTLSCCELTNDLREIDMALQAAI